MEESLHNQSAISRRVQASLTRMAERQNAGIKYDLETIRRLLRRIGDPQTTFAAIHVAGTNGKGSVCASLDAGLRAAGLHVGLYTSPHLIRFNERIRINGEQIGDDSLAALIEIVETADHGLAHEPGGRPATFFEFMTALAFLAFQRHGLPVAVIETGLGGRLDATNVLTPAISVITRIGLDHAEWLGNDLPTIAAEKAGIIKPGRPVIAGAMPAAAFDVIARTARERGAPLVSAPESVSVRPGQGKQAAVAVQGMTQDYGTIPFPLPVGYRLENLATSMAALETFCRVAGIPLKAEILGRGLGAVLWPARLQLLRDKPPVILDGAHNPEGVEALLKAVTTEWRHRPIGLVTGICEDKDYLTMLRRFRRRVRRCWTVSFNSPRALSCESLATAARSLGAWEVTPSSVPEALDAAVRWAGSVDGVVLIAGSLFLAGDILKLDQWRRPQHMESNRSRNA